MGSRIGWFFGKLISIAAMVSSAVLMCGVYMSKMFPTKYIMAGGAVLLVLLVLIAVLTWNSNGKVRYVIGIILGIAITAAAVIGSRYVFKTVDTAKQITTASTEVSQIGVYVTAANNDDFATAASGYQYGIVKEIDRDSTDQALAQLKKDYSPTKEAKEYDSLPQLVTALKGGEVNAILMNTAFTDVLAEMDDFKNINDEIKLVKTYNIQSTAKSSSADSESNMNSEYSGSTFALYISGIDTRSDTLSAKSRSDVNILAVINPETHQILLVSTPRDYYVPLSISNGAKDKLTHAGIYGIQVSVDTMGMIYDLDIDYYFRVNFTGFEKIIDALGGVTVDSEYAFTGSGYTFTKGENKLDGKEALAFCRERHAFASGDNQRGKNQMAMIKAVISKMMSVDMLKNYTNVLSAMEGCFETSMPYDTIGSLVKTQLDSGAGWNIVSYSVTGTGSQAVPYSMSQSAYVMIPNEADIATAKAMIKQVYDGKVISKTEAAGETETGVSQGGESENSSVTGTSGASAQ